MFATRTALAAVIVLVGHGFSSEPAHATFWGGAAARIQNNSALLNQEFRLNYVHSPVYRQLLSNSKQMFLRAQHLRLLVLNGPSRHGVVRDLLVLERSHQNLAQLLLVHGSTPQVNALMTQIGCDINSLRIQLASLVRWPVYYVVPRTPAPSQPARNFGEVRSGWTRTLESISGGETSASKSSNNRRSLSAR